MNPLTEQLAALIAELKSDLDRPGGRWGIHGHDAVDDDYFLALKYVIKRLEGLSSNSKQEEVKEFKDSKTLTVSTPISQENPEVLLKFREYADTIMDNHCNYIQPVYSLIYDPDLHTIPLFLFFNNL